MKINIDTQYIKIEITAIYMAFHRCGPVKIGRKLHPVCNLCNYNIKSAINRIIQHAKKEKMLIDFASKEEKAKYEKAWDDYMKRKQLEEESE